LPFPYRSFLFGSDLKASFFDYIPIHPDTPEAVPGSIVAGDPQGIFFTIPLILLISIPFSASLILFCRIGQIPAMR